MNGNCRKPISFWAKFVSQVTIELDVPKDWRKFRLPRALDERLQELLDRQDHDGKLSRAERREAEALAELAEMLSLMKLKAERISRTERA
jgi:hypothetical protein